MFALTTGASSGGAGAGVLIFELIFYVIGCIPLYGVFKKAGRPGWEAFIPIYNAIVGCWICGITAWFLLLALIPFVGGLALDVIFGLAMAKSFGKTVGWAIALMIPGVNWIMLWVLWLGQSRYVGPVGLSGPFGGSAAYTGGYPPGGYGQPGGYPPQGGYGQPGGYPPQGGYAPPGQYPQQPQPYPQQYPQQAPGQYPQAPPPQAPPQPAPGQYPQAPPQQYPPQAPPQQYPPQAPPQPAPGQYPPQAPPPYPPQ
jgi:hypothetical protein